MPLHDSENSLRHSRSLTNLGQASCQLTEDSQPWSSFQQLATHPLKTMFAPLNLITANVYRDILVRGRRLTFSSQTICCLSSRPRHMPEGGPAEAEGRHREPPAVWLLALCTVNALYRKKSSAAACRSLRKSNPPRWSSPKATSWPGSTNNNSFRSIFLSSRSPASTYG